MNHNNHLPSNIYICRLRFYSTLVDYICQVLNLFVHIFNFYLLLSNI